MIKKYMLIIENDVFDDPVLFFTNSSLDATEEIQKCEEIGCAYQLYTWQGDFYQIGTNGYSIMERERINNMMNEGD